MDYEILWHVSFEAVDVFVPRIPNNRAPNENNTTPRISFSENINFAISSMPDGGKALRGMLKARRKVTPILHLYSCLVWENPDIPFVRPEDVQDEYGVPDAKACREWWALKTPNMTHCIVKVESADCKDGIDLAGNHGVTVSNIKYDIIKILPQNAPEMLLNEPLIQNIGLRTAFAAFDGTKNIKRSIKK